MAIEKIKGRNPRGSGIGRQKGTPNKFTANARELIQTVATGLGGAEGMLKWAKSNDVNERIFWSQIYPKTLPKEIKAEVEATLQTRFDEDQLAKMAKEFLRKKG